MANKLCITVDKTQPRVNPFWRLCLTFSGICLLHLSLGASFIIGNIVPYVVSYMRLAGKEPTLKYSDGIWLASMVTTGFGFSMLFSTYLERMLGFRKTLLFGALIQSVSTLLSYFTIQSHYYLFVITEGFLNGAGCAIPYIVSMSCAMKWLPNRKATATGIVLFFHGMSAFIFNFVSTGFINPENYKENLHIDGEEYFAQKDLLARVPKCFLMLGGIFIISQIISVCMISNPEEKMTVYIQDEPGIAHDSLEAGKENKAFQDKDVAINSKDQSSEEKSNNIRDKDENGMKDESKPVVLSKEERESEENYYTPLQMMKTNQFYLLWLITFLDSQLFTTITGMYKIYGLTFISDDYFLTILGSVCAVGNALARLIWGVICDKLLFKDSSILLCYVVSVLFLLLNISHMAGRYFYFFVVVLTYMSASGVYIFMPYIINKSYGNKYYTSNCGIVYTSLIVGGVLNAFTITAMQEAVGWYWTFFFYQLLAVIGIVLTVMFQKTKRLDRKQSEVRAPTKPPLIQQ